MTSLPRCQAEESTVDSHIHALERGDIQNTGGGDSKREKVPTLILPTKSTKNFQSKYIELDEKPWAVRTVTTQDSRSSVELDLP